MSFPVVPVCCLLFRSFVVGNVHKRITCFFLNISAVVRFRNRSVSLHTCSAVELLLYDDK